ncbi:MAG: hypothetical protein LBB68_03025 [Treponema sp.]|nr:hypothetical protein [Treponema sp.]
MMKQFMVTLFMVIFCIHFASARDPVYTTERLDDGRMAIKCPTEDDALILINDYNLPDKFVLIVLLKGISFEEPELNKLLTEMKLYQLMGTKLTHAKDFGYKHGLTIMNDQYFNVNKNTEYFVFFNVELNPIMEMSKKLGIDNPDADKYAASILIVTDTSLNPIIGRK